MSRTEAKLQDAQQELQDLARSLRSSCIVSYKVTDVTDPAKIKASLAAAVEDLGPIDLLIANAGCAKCGYFHEMDLSAFESQMRINYFGVLHTVHAAYPAMVARDRGHLVLVGSALSTFGMVGYSAYCPSKYAVKGLADCLRNELLGTKVRVSLAMPPDTDTPGFANENQDKPMESKEISETGGTLFTPDQVASVLMKGILRGDYLLGNPDLGLQLHATINKGLIPRSFPGVLLDMLLGLLGPIISWVYAGAVFDRVARKHAGARFAKLRRQ